MLPTCFRRIRRVVLPGSLLGSWLLLAAAGRAQQAYSFVNVAESGDILAGFSVPSLDDFGVTAFQASFLMGGSAILAGDGGPLSTVAATGATFTGFGFPGASSTNNSGNVAFAGFRTDGSRGIFLGDTSGGTPAVIARNGDVASGALTFSFFQTAPSLNNLGVVAFNSQLSNNSSGVFTDSVSGPLTAIARTTGAGGTFGSLPVDANINDAGFATFYGQPSGGGEGFFAGNGGAVSTVANNLGGMFGTFPTVRPPSINESGDIAFRGFLNPSGSGIFVGDNLGGTVSTVEDTSTGFSSFSFGSTTTSINNAGSVAFLAAADTGTSGLFLKMGSDSASVLTLGAPLFGSTLSFLELSPQALNAVGQVAFYYQLDDGRTGIALANPVPEPGGWLLLAVGALGLGCSRRMLRVPMLAGDPR